MQGSIVQTIIKNNVAYNLLDYIQSTGTQYINTGIQANGNTQWELDLKFNTINDNQQSGARQSGTSQNRFDFGSYQNKWVVAFGNGYATSQNNADTNRHTFIVNSNDRTLYIDGTRTIWGAGTTLSQSLNLYLFNRNYSGSKEFSTGSQATLYSSKITKDGSLVQHLIPVERITDNVLGMLDLVSGNFLTNAGSGTFTKGSYIKVEHIYKPKYKVKTYEKLDYLKGNGTSTYINLGIAPKSNTNVELVAYQENDYLGDDRVLIGGGTTWNNNTELAIGVYRSSTQHFFEKGMGGIESGTTQVIGVKNTYKIQDNKAYINGVAKYTFTNTTINTTYPLYLFALHRHAVSPSIMNYSNARIYSCKLWEGTVLKLDLIPVKRLSDNAYGMLDTLTNTFYGNAGTGAFTGQSLSTPEYIEEDVEQVDYIQASGTQYINTLLNLEPSKTIIDTKYEWTSQPSQYDRVFGVMDSSTTQLALTADTTTTQMGTYYAEQGANLGTISLNTPYTLTMKNGQVILNGTSRSVQTKTGTLVNRLILFGLNNNGTITRLSKSKIYYFKITHNGEVIMNLIPVKYGTEYCMLDLVENKLYHNKGTGAFSGGNRVEVSKITQCLISNNVKYYPLDYIQSSGTQYLTTNIKPNGNERFEISFTPLEWNTDNNNVVCGARNSGTLGIYVFGSIASAYGGGSRLANFGVNQNFATKPTINVKHTIRYEREKMWYDGTLYTATGRQLVQVNSNMLIFAGATDTYEVQSFTKMKLHEFIVYNEDGTEKEHWLPMQRASDNVLGMLDIISGEFKVNSGTGTFTGNKREIILVE